MLHESGKCTRQFHKDLKIELTRLPFHDSTNKSMMSLRKNQPQKKKEIADIEETSRKLVNRYGNKVSSSTTVECKVTANRRTESEEQKELIRARKKLPDRDISVRQSASLKKRLRKCQQKNYFESTLEQSTVIEAAPPSIIKPKIPIYRQNVSTESKKQGEDPYELDISDSNKGKPKGKQKNMNMNTSRKFNKTIYDVLEKLEKAKRKPRKKTSKIKSLRPPGEYEKNINNALKKVMNKINEKKKLSISQGENEAEVGQILEGDNINPQSTKADKDKLVINKFVPDTENTSQDHGSRRIQTMHGNKNTQNSLEVGNMVQTPSISRINIISDVGLTTNNSPVGYYNESNSNNLHSDEFFGFSDDDNINPVSKSMESPAVFAQRRPNANSTMIGSRSKSPWRVTTFLTRRPYLLSVKRSALPNLQQEMILDHTLVEDIEKHQSKSVLEASNPKLPVQTTMLDYVVSSVDHSMDHDQENIAHSSLFNYEEFNVAKPKRRVLGTLQECSVSDRQAVSTPIPGFHGNMSPNMSAIDEDSNFGFETTSFVRDKENRFSKAKPYRLNLAGIKMNKNKIPNENLEDDSTLDLEEERSNKYVSEDVSMKMSTENNTDVHLFDDIDKEFDGEMTIQLPVLKYQRNARRKRLQSDASDDGEDTKPKKKKKDMMTKAEEAAFDKWAAEFNSMCDEVDQHHLEIE